MEKRGKRLLSRFSVNSLTNSSVIGGVVSLVKLVTKVVGQAMNTFANQRKSKSPGQTPA